MCSRLPVALMMALSLAMVGLAGLLPLPGAAFLAGQAERQTLPAPGTLQVGHVLAEGKQQKPAAAAVMGSLHHTVGSRGLLCYGMGFGLLAALLHGSSRLVAGRAVARRAAEIEVQEKTETKVLPYFESVPKSFMNKRTLDLVLASLPREQWDDPPEDHPLYALKLLSETYGEGKATKMRWWDYWYLQEQVLPKEAEFEATANLMKDVQAEFNLMLEGKVPLYVPGIAATGGNGFWETGATIQWRGPEPFAGDQTMSPVTDSKFAKDFLSNLAFYREGLKPWQRGLEIGMAHGYFIIGPFVSLGPLRNTPEAATVGLLSGVALILIASSGGLLFGQTIKPTFFDKPGDKSGAGFTELINWHIVGGIGGAGFAHALITVFGQ